MQFNNLNNKICKEKNAVIKGLGLCDDAGYHCDLYMPHKTPFRNKITGRDGDPASSNI